MIEQKLKYLKARPRVFLSIFAFFGISVISLITSFVYKAKSKVIYEIATTDMNSLRSSNDSVQPVRISRYSVQDSVVIRFPKGGTVAHLFIYKQSEYERFMNDIKVENPMNFENRIHEMEIDFTGIPDGNYLGVWLTCHNGGRATIQLETKK